MIISGARYLPIATGLQTSIQDAGSQVLGLRVMDRCSTQQGAVGTSLSEAPATFASSFGREGIMMCHCPSSWAQIELIRAAG